MIQDAINSIRVTLGERFGNPFLSAALISAVFLNWKLSLLLLSDVQYDNKVSRITELYPHALDVTYAFLVYPGICGAFWTFLWPVLSMAINAYWYWMRSNVANVRLWAERKKILSEAEAARIYSILDEQEGKYFEFLKERQSRIDDLSSQILTLTEGRSVMEKEIDGYKSEIEKFKVELLELKRNLALKHDDFQRVQMESEGRKQKLDGIYSCSVDFAKYIPGLKEITLTINNTTNYKANESWLKEEFKRQTPSVSGDVRRKNFDFLLALGLIKKESDGVITFGERYQHVREVFIESPDDSLGQKTKVIATPLS